MMSQKDEAILLVKDKVADRFWSKVGITANPDRCWEWQGNKGVRNYGYFSVTVSPDRDLPVIPTRIMYYLHYGVHPSGKCVCHTCDNPKCVNPTHLFLGTNKDNTQDMIAKGRRHDIKGSACTWSKLTEEKVLEIRAKYGTGESSYKKLGEEYNVEWSGIRDIIKRVNWKHI